MAGRSARSAGWRYRWTVPFAVAFTLLAVGFVYELWRHVGTAGDFWTFWAASRALHAGLDPYVTGNLVRVAALPAGAGAPGPFLSPIVLAQIFEPLGALSFTAARLVWLGLNLALSAALVPLLLRLGGIQLRWRSVLAGTALLLAFQPYDLTLWLGQTDVLVVVAIAAGWLLIRRGRPYLGGLAVAVAAVDVHLVLAFGLYFLVTAAGRERRNALLGLATGLVALGVACLAHPADVAQWLLVTLPHAQAAAIEPWDTLSVLQAGSEILGLQGGRILAGLLDVALAALAILAWRRRGATPDRDLAVCAALALATTTFAYNQDYLLLVLAFPFIARQWRADASWVWTGALAFSLAVGFGLAELTGGPVAPNHAAFIIGAPLLALAVLGCLPTFRTRRGRVHRLWAAAWALATVGGYAAFTVSGSEIGAEVLMLSGVLAFLALVGWHAARGAPAGPASRGDQGLGAEG